MTGDTFQGWPVGPILVEEQPVEQLLPTGLLRRAAIISETL